MRGNDGYHYGPWANGDLPERTTSAPPILQEGSPFGLFPFPSWYAGNPSLDINQEPPKQVPTRPYHHTLSSQFSPDNSYEDLPITIRQQYSPSNSPPPMRKTQTLPRNYEENDGYQVSARNMIKPKPNRVSSVSSLEDYTFDENQLIPDLSSDSESVSSSVDDLSSLLVQSVTLSHQSSNGDITSLLNSTLNRYLWESPDSPDVSARERRKSDVNIIDENNSYKLQDFPLNSPGRRKPDQLDTPDLLIEDFDSDSITSTEDPSKVICRYYAQGYCSRGARCNFMHVPRHNEQFYPSGPVQVAEVPEIQEEQPNGNHLSVPGNNPNSKKKNSTSQLGHKRSQSSGFPSRASVPPTPSMFMLEAMGDPGRMTSIDQVIGQIYPMCKDQHGCRFLQKKLDEGESSVIDAIFNEVYPYFAELMTDPFGNYLCQKLLEHCTGHQRYLLIENVTADLVRVSRNMHGTRAVQKMIECLTAPSEIQLVINGLKASVVTLIKDLNGNHVVQRCLNHLSPQYNQFIYDAVASHCVEVATHRHGCCVLQRCIDHAIEKQKLQLVTEIAVNALPLVKDPYGNYVVQYVLDLPYPGLISTLISKFETHLAELSTQKFSSNVVEKCLIVGQPMTRLWMIMELTESDQLHNLIQDPFGNYVIQTAMKVADPSQHGKLMEQIKPYLPALRNTPYGKRIQNKVLKQNPPNRRHK